MTIILKNIIYYKIILKLMLKNNTKNLKGYEIERSKMYIKFWSMLHFLKNSQKLICRYFLKIADYAIVIRSEINF